MSIAKACLADANEYNENSLGRSRGTWACYQHSKAVRCRLFVRLTQRQKKVLLSQICCFDEVVVRF